jgi:hypothetical protein
MTAKKSYIWRCMDSKQLASIDMMDSDMANLGDIPGAVQKMLSDVARVIGTTDHTHIFTENKKKSPEDVVIFDCPGKIDPSSLKGLPR